MSWQPLPQQLEVIKECYNAPTRHKDKTLEIMLSGNIGSAKSTTMAHIIASHCLRYDRAMFGIGRKALPRLKETLAHALAEHMRFDLNAGDCFKYHETRGSFAFRNGSRIIPFSWSDRNFKKFRSYGLSGMAIEELTENDDDERDCYFESIQRVGRASAKIPERIMITATNPGSPSSEWYKHFYLGQNEHRKVYELKAADNPYLPAGYIDNLRNILDAKQAMRQLDGMWIEIESEVVYYAYDRGINFKNESYNIDPRLPIHMTWDFNIGDGKPLSVAFLQHTPTETHVYNEVVVDGQRTLDACEESMERGLLPKNHRIIINGDASGRSRDTRGKQSDYALIEKFMANSNVRFEIDVPTANPRVRDRHNIVNGRICNANNRRSLFVYKDAPTADEAFRMTALKKGGQYVEDDSKRFQHIGTAIGYSLCSYMKNISIVKGSTESIARFGIMR